MSYLLKNIPLRTCVYLVETPSQPFDDVIHQQLVGAYAAKIVALKDLQLALSQCPNEHIVMVAYSYERTKAALKNLDKSIRDRHELHLIYQHIKPDALPSKYFRSTEQMPSGATPKAQLKGLTRIIHAKFNDILKQITLQHRESLRSTLKNPEYFKNRFELLVAAHHNKHAFSTASMAKMLEISVSTLERKVKEHYQTLPKQFLLEYRLQKAKQLLGYSSKKVQEISPLCGFKSASYFSVRFTDRFGLSPTQLRHEMRNEFKNVAS